MDSADQGGFVRYDEVGVRRYRATGKNGLASLLSGSCDFGPAVDATLSGQS